MSGQGTPCTHNKLLLHWSGEQDFSSARMVRQVHYERVITMVDMAAMG